MPTDSSWLQLTLFGAAKLARVRPAAPAHAMPLCLQSRRLLAYLALGRGNPRSRDQLSQALGDGAGEPASPGSVSSALWRLRQTLEGPPFVAGDLLVRQRDGHVGLRDDAPLTVDVEQYLQRVLPALALPLEALDAAATGRLRDGVALYTADLLPGSAEDWVLREREKLRHHQLNALGRLVQLSARAGDTAAGIRYAQAILDIEELREDVHRELMRLFLAAGQRALALRQYERCRSALRRELAIVPMPETQALYQQIAAGAVARHGVADIAADVAADSTVESPATERDRSELLSSARRHLAAADAQLVQAMPRH